MRKKLFTAATFLFALWGVWSFKNNVSALPSFARKTGLECNSCHTVIPKLTEMGYRFRAAGFRMPDEINKPAEYKEIGQFAAAMIENHADYSRQSSGGQSSHSFQFVNERVGLFPVNGAFAKNLACRTEITLASGSSPDIENAYVRWVHGSENHFLSTRFGIFHPWEGYGASDMPVGASSPLFETSTASYNADTYFQLRGFNQMGLEVAYDLPKTTVAADVFNGFSFNGGGIDPAVGGDLVKPSDARSSNAKDYQIVVNHLLTDDGGGVSAVYYRGTLDLPADTTGFFQNNFHRAALYGSYPLAKKLYLLAGGGIGMDQYFDPATGSSNKRFGSGGGFGELDFYAHPRAVLAGRFDWFDPSDRRKDNRVWALTGALNAPWNNGFQLVAEFQYRHTQEGAGQPGLKEELAQLWALVIF